MEATLDNQTLQPTTSPRKGFIAFLLSLLAPGLGQVYNGQPKKAIIIWLVLIAHLFVCDLTNGTHSFYGLINVVLIGLVFEIIIIADAVKNAKNQKQYIKKNYNKWFYYILIIIANAVIQVLIDTRSVLEIQTYKVVTSSSNPTLQTGDFIVAEKKTHEFSHGDIVVFNSPEKEKWIFRVVGLPNDRIELNDNIVSINGKPSKSTFVKESVSDNIPVSEFIEELPYGHKHNIYKFTHVPFDSSKSTMKEIVVPSDSYYLLGDNRDNAVDSRYIGCIKRDDILGKIIYSFWGSTSDRINIDFRVK